MLSPPFGGLVAFVKEAEALIERGQAERLRGEEGMRLLSWDQGGELNRTVRGGQGTGGGIAGSTAVPWAGLAGVDGPQAWLL